MKVFVRNIEVCGIVTFVSVGILKNSEKKQEGEAEDVYVLQTF